MSDTLFDPATLPGRPAPAPIVHPIDGRLPRSTTAGQRAKFRAGIHPITGERLDLTRCCGDCRFRVHVGGRANRPFPKCERDRSAPVQSREVDGRTYTWQNWSRGRGSDVAASFPACTLFETVAR